MPSSSYQPGRAGHSSRGAPRQVRAAGGARKSGEVPGTPRSLSMSKENTAQGRPPSLERVETKSPTPTGQARSRTQPFLLSKDPQPPAPNINAPPALTQGPSFTRSTTSSMARNSVPVSPCTRATSSSPSSSKSTASTYGRSVPRNAQSKSVGNAKARAQSLQRDSTGSKVDGANSSNQFEGAVVRARPIPTLSARARSPPVSSKFANAGVNTGFACARSLPRPQTSALGLGNGIKRPAVPPAGNIKATGRPSNKSKITSTIHDVQVLSTVTQLSAAVDKSLCSSLPSPNVQEGFRIKYPSEILAEIAQPKAEAIPGITVGRQGTSVGNFDTWSFSEDTDTSDSDTDVDSNSSESISVDIRPVVFTTPHATVEEITTQRVDFKPSIAFYGLSPKPDDAAIFDFFVNGPRFLGHFEGSKEETAEALKRDSGVILPHPTALEHSLCPQYTDAPLPAPQSFTSRLVSSIKNWRRSSASDVVPIPALFDHQRECDLLERQSSAAAHSAPILKSADENSTGARENRSECGLLSLEEPMVHQAQGFVVPLVYENKLECDLIPLDEARERKALAPMLAFQNKLECELISLEAARERFASGDKSSRSSKMSCLRRWFARA